MSSLAIRNSRRLPSGLVAHETFSAPVEPHIVPHAAPYNGLHHIGAKALGVGGLTGGPPGSVQQSTSLACLMGTAGSGLRLLNERSAAQWARPSGNGYV